MGHLLPAVSLEPENRGRSDTPVAQAFVPNAPAGTQRASLQPQDVRDVTAALHHALEAQTQPPASIIHAATEFARILTGAHGVALGIRIKRALVCRARSGDLAPELGSALNANSGISGECLRSASILVCDDAENDDRVDRGACRALGVRSIVAVPVRGNMGILGMLEAFSRMSSAFTAAQIEALRAMTEVIEAAYAAEMHEPGKVAVSVAKPRVPTVKRAIPRVITSSIPEDRLSRQILCGRSPRRRYWFAGVAVIALPLSSLGVWLSLHDPTPETAASEVPAAVAPQKVDLKPAPRHTTFLKPEAGIAPRRLERKHSSAALRTAAEISPMRNESVPGNNSAASLPPEEVGEGFIGSSASNAAEPVPVKIEIVSGPAPLPMVATTPTLPVLETRTSQGATEARLIHEVQPVYPAQARALRLSGDVTLNVTIAEDGRVRGIGVVSGAPLLAASAMEAVRQWRYTPSRLNGKPTPVEKQITVMFKLP